MTSLLAPLLKGSLNIATGCRYISEFDPSAWYVLDPSKFQTGHSTKHDSRLYSLKIIANKLELSMGIDLCVPQYSILVRMNASFRRRQLKSVS